MENYSDPSCSLLSQKKLICVLKTVESPGTSSSAEVSDLFMQGFMKYQNYRNLHLSAWLLKNLLFSRIISTYKMYFLGRFAAFCGESRFSVEQPKILLIFEFLQDGLDLGYWE